MSEVKDKDYYDNGEYEDDYDYVVCVFGKDDDVNGDVNVDVKGNVKGDLTRN